MGTAFPSVEVMGRHLFVCRALMSVVGDWFLMVDNLQVTEGASVVVCLEVITVRDW